MVRCSTLLFVLFVAPILAACSTVADTEPELVPAERVQFEVAQLNGAVAAPVEVTVVVTNTAGRAAEGADVLWSTYLVVPHTDASRDQTDDEFWPHDLEPRMTRTDRNGRTSAVLVPPTQGMHHVIATVGAVADTAIIVAGFSPNSSSRLTWILLPVMPTSLYWMAPTSSGTGIYIIAGSDGNPRTACACRGSTLILDPGSQSWTVGAPPLPPTFMVSTAKVSGVAASLVDGVHFIYGTRHFIYAPTENVWSERTAPPASGGALEAVAGKLYLTTASALNVYDPATGSWSLRAPMPTPRCCAATGVLDGRIYVAGGGGANGPVRSFERYDPATNSWSTLAPMPFPRASLSGAVIGQFFCVFGGHADIWRGDGLSQTSDWTFRETYCYDPATNAWGLEPPVPYDRVSGISAVEFGDAIYAFGGGKYLSSGLWQTTNQAAKLSLR